MMKRGVLLMAYGAPGSLDEVEPFCTDIRGGRKPSPELLEELLERYRAIGGKSPLLEITQCQADALTSKLGDDYAVYIGMRHWDPRIAEAVSRMAEDGITEAVAIVLAPHYSRMSIGKYMEVLDAAVEEQQAGIVFHRVTEWHVQSHFISSLESRVRAAMRRFSDRERAGLEVVFTAHSLPERIREWDDPYHNQLLETCWLVARHMGLEKWSLGYQSAGRTPEPWLGPDLLDVIAEKAEAGEKALLVCVIGFVADHLEVLYDIDVEARAAAQEKGIHLERIDMLNDDPMLIDALAEITTDAFARGTLT